MAEVRPRGYGSPEEGQLGLQSDKATEELGKERGKGIVGKPNDKGAEARDSSASLGTSEKVDVARLGKGSR